MPLTILDYLAAGAFGLSLVLLYQRRTKATPLPLPPGPQRWPLVGSLPSIPKGVDLPIVFSQWGEEYGDVCYARLPGQDIIILNSYEAATELLDRRSAIYSSRPSQVMAGQLVGWENLLGMLPYGERMRKTRKLLYEGMSVRAMTDLYPLQEREAIKFLQRLLKTPEQLQGHIHQTVGSSLLRLTYGYNVEGVNDHLIVLANDAMAMFSIAAMPGAWMVDLFPFLKHIPWMSFRAKAKEWRKLAEDFATIPMDFVHKKMKSGDGEPCLTARWVERDIKGKGNDKELAEYNKSLVEWGSSALVLAGTDTTASAVATFFGLMALHPEVQAKAQTEISQVIGNDRLPTYSDRNSLPYVEAVYKEVLRWHPIVPIGLPHLSTATTDDEFRGMRIPKGSVAFAMIGNMLHDPQMYPDPQVFNPERFMGPPEDMARNPENIIFGFGRRRCPGINVAHSSIWLAITFVLATYNITPALGPDGKPLSPKMKFTRGVISRLEPYQCTITPRSPKAISLIEEAVPEMIV
ncbi:O-methylsterigmatocystin oxidoreductase [Rhizoctonia solani]|uniref:O-methylsterigmatocystin oxidoreductase n=1 Tax=Rhizoctonia solani TaxID=456999 RepID=A0A0K6FP96_9AGAM|nr:O-methylsterigmatocystin oxidoreductase [Rhizoctonia solani]